MTDTLLESNINIAVKDYVLSENIRLIVISANDVADDEIPSTSQTIEQTFIRSIETEWLGNEKRRKFNIVFL